jgi:hypothetical protein
LRGKLASLNNQVSGTATQSASAAHSTTPTQSTTPRQSATPAQSGSGYSFNAVKDGNAETLTLSGSLPDQAARQAMLAAAKRMFPTDRIVDNTEIKPGAPPEFGKTASSLLKELSRLGSGNAKITGSDAEISGSAFSDQAASAIKTALASLPGLHVKTDVATTTATTVDPADCQKLPGPDSIRDRQLKYRSRLHRTLGPSRWCRATLSVSDLPGRGLYRLGR